MELVPRKQLLLYPLSQGPCNDKMIVCKTLQTLEPQHESDIINGFDLWCHWCREFPSADTSAPLRETHNSVTSGDLPGDTEKLRGMPRVTQTVNYQRLNLGLPYLCPQLYGASSKGGRGDRQTIPHSKIKI